MVGKFLHMGRCYMAAYDAELGSEHWRVEFDLPLLGATVAADGRVAVTDLDGRLYVLSQVMAHAYGRASATPKLRGF